MTVLPSPEATIVICTVVLIAYTAHVLDKAFASSEQFEAMLKARERIMGLQAENAKLRELVRDMYGFIERTDEECGDVTFSDCFDYCKHDATDDGCCKTGECWYEQRMRELRVEVDG